MSKEGQNKIEEVQEQIAEVEEKLSAIQQRRAEIESRKPEVSSRAMKGDKGAVKELADMNARLGELPDQIAGMEFEIMSLKDRALALEAELDSSRRAAIMGEFEKTRGELDKTVTEIIESLGVTHAALGRLARCHESLSQLSTILGGQSAPPSWSGVVAPITRKIKDMARSGRRYGLDLR